VHLHIGRKITRRAALVLAVVGIALASLVVVGPQKASAASTTCRTIYVHSYDDGGTNQPWMYVPVCYNGSTIWMNGHISPGITTIGPSFGGFTWYGWYNDSSRRWLGIGENYTLTIGFYTTSCLPRWYINASGGVYGHTDNC
jgi:hypothetical protein